MNEKFQAEEASHEQVAEYEALREKPSFARNPEEELRIKQLEIEALEQFLLSEKEAYEIRRILEDDPNKNSKSIEENIKILREKCAKHPLLGLESDDLRHNSYTVAESKDALLNYELMPLTEVPQIEVPALYHWTTKAQLASIQKYGMLPEFCRGQGRAQYNYAAFLENQDWANIVGYGKNPWLRGQAEEQAQEYVRDNYALLKLHPDETTFYTWGLKNIPSIEGFGSGIVQEESQYGENEYLDIAQTRDTSKRNPTFGHETGAILVPSNVVPLEKVLGLYAQEDERLIQDNLRSKRKSDRYKKMERILKQKPWDYDDVVWQFSPILGKEVPPTGLTIRNDENTEILFDYIPPAQIEVVT